MIKLSPEAKVGLFVLVGVMLLVYMSLKVSGVKLGRGKGYEITVKFDTVAGLDLDAPVMIGGVEIGRVKEIVLEDFRPKLVLRIHPQAIIGKDFTAIIRTKGLLGEKYVELVPGPPGAPPLEDGGVITRTATFTDPEKLITQLSDIANDVKGISEALSKAFVGKKGEATLKNIFNNIEAITTNLDKTIQTVNKTISMNEEKFNSLVSNLEAFSRILSERGPTIIESMQSVTASLDQVINENRDNLKVSLANLREASTKIEGAFDSISALTESINSISRNVVPDLEETLSSVKSIAGKIDRGEGTIGKLVNDEETVEGFNKTLADVRKLVGKAEKFETFVGFRSEFLFDSSEAKSFVTLTLQPTPNKFYYFELIDDPRDREKFEKQGGAGDLGETKYSAQIAGKFDNIILRGGLLESSGGVGIDYLPFDDRLRFTFEASDFDKDRRPRLKFAATYDLNKYFFVTGGYDDFISRQGLETLFLGFGLRFEDEDLRDLLITAK